MLNWFIWMHVIALWPVWLWLSIVLLHIVIIIGNNLLEGYNMWIFWVLHLFAVLVFPLALFITIPLHVIAGKK